MGKNPHFPHLTRNRTSVRWGETRIISCSLWIIAPGAFGLNLAAFPAIDHPTFWLRTSSVRHGNPKKVPCPIQ